MLKLLSKAKRELSVFLSKFCLKSMSSNYFGLHLKFPILYGMGRGYIIPAEKWMGDCLQAFVTTKPGCVIDIGVNVGVYLVKLRSISKNTPYFGFEPNHACNFYTQELIRLNSFANSRVFPFALSNEQKIMTLYASKLGDKGGSLVQDYKKGQQTNYSFDVITMVGDEFIKRLDIEEISAIKIDVEGAEVDVMNGLLNSIKQYRPYLYCEIWSKTNKEGADKIFTYMTGLNYAVFGLNKANNHIEPILNSNSFSDKYSAEYLFVPKELESSYFNQLATQDIGNISLPIPR